MQLMKISLAVAFTAGSVAASWTSRSYRPPSAPLAHRTQQQTTVSLPRVVRNMRFSVLRFSPSGHSPVVCFRGPMSPCVISTVQIARLSIYLRLVVVSHPGRPCVGVGVAGSASVHPAEGRWWGRQQRGKDRWSVHRNRSRHDIQVLRSAYTLGISSLTDGSRSGGDYPLPSLMV